MTPANEIQKNTYDASTIIYPPYIQNDKIYTAVTMCNFIVIRVNFRHMSCAMDDALYKLVEAESQWRTCVGKLTIIGSVNGLSPGLRQAIIWASAGILLIGPLGTNFSEILIRIQTFSLKKMY